MALDLFLSFFILWCLDCGRSGITFEQLTCECVCVCVCVRLCTYGVCDLDKFRLILFDNLTFT